MKERGDGKRMRIELVLSLQGKLHKTKEKCQNGAGKKEYRDLNRGFQVYNEVKILLKIFVIL